MSQPNFPSFKMSLRPLALCVSLALTACGGAEMSAPSSTAAQPEAMSGNSVSGIGMPNPNPVVTQNWATCQRAAIGGRLLESISIPPMGKWLPTSAVAPVISVQEYQSTAIQIRLIRFLNSTAIRVKCLPTSAGA